MHKDVALELRQLVQRGLDHHEHGRLHDAVADWETALRLQPRNLQAKRLVDFGRQRTAEIEAGRHTSPSRRDTLESPIPQFLAALTERKSEKVTVSSKDDPRVRASMQDDITDEDWSVLAMNKAKDRSSKAAPTKQADDADTLEDLPVNAEDVRASATELIAECRAALNDNRPSPAALAAELSLQLAERAPPPGVDDLIEPSRALFERAFRAFMGNPHGCPIRAVPTETLADHGLDQRAAFLMSRMDGMTSLADLIDASGMARFDAVRVICALRRAKAIDVLPPLG